MPAIIDSHLLLASPDTDRFPPLDGTDPAELAELAQPKDLEALMQAGTLAGAVLVQRGKTYGFDNSLICSLAKADGRLRAICAVDGRREDCGTRARDLLSRPGVAGLRLMEPEKGANLDWLCGPHALAAWRAAAQAGAVMDVHVFPWNRAAGLGVLEKLLGEFPDMRVVLDNLGNPALEDGAPDFGVDVALLKVTERERVFLKVSAMSFARVGKAGLEPAALMEAMVKRFGAHRLCWGSDMLLGSATLESAITEALDAAGGLSESDATMVLQSTAQKLFGLDELK